MAIRVPCVLILFIVPIYDLLDASRAFCIEEFMRLRGEFQIASDDTYICRPNRNFESLKQTQHRVFIHGALSERLTGRPISISCWLFQYRAQRIPSFVDTMFECNRQCPHRPKPIEHIFYCMGTEWARAAEIIQQNWPIDHYPQIDLSLSRRMSNFLSHAKQETDC